MLKLRLLCLHPHTNRFTVEQPTDIGLPAIYGLSFHAMLSLGATPEYKTVRGMIKAGIEYDAHIFAHGQNAMYVRFPLTKKLYGIAQVCSLLHLNCILLYPVKFDRVKPINVTHEENGSSDIKKVKKWQ